MVESLSKVQGGEDKEKKVAERSYALVMVKPHAMREASDTVILDIFSGGVEKHKKYLEPDRSITDALSKSELLTYFYRDLSDPRYETVLKTLYAKEQGKRHYDLVIDQYTGPCMFILLASSDPNIDLNKEIQKFKGKERLLGKNGDVIQSGYGLRGLLVPPRTVIDLDDPTDDDIRKITNNVVHVVDEDIEEARVLRTLLNTLDLNKLFLKDPELKNFLDKNAPVSIV